MEISIDSKGEALSENDFTTENASALILRRIELKRLFIHLGVD